MVHTHKLLVASRFRSKHAHPILPPRCDDSAARAPRRLGRAVWCGLRGGPAGCLLAWGRRLLVLWYIVWPHCGNRIVASLGIIMRMPTQHILSTVDKGPPWGPILVALHCIFNFKSCSFQDLRGRRSARTSHRRQPQPWGSAMRHEASPSCWLATSRGPCRNRFESCARCVGKHLPREARGACWGALSGRRE